MRELAGKFRRDSGQMQELIRGLDADTTNSNGIWQGPAAHSFRGDWSGLSAQATTCSVTFLKSARARTVSATLVWEVHWEGSDGTNEPLDPPATPEVGSFTTQVDEVQTVVDGT